MKNILQSRRIKDGKFQRQEIDEINELLRRIVTNESKKVWYEETR